MKKKDVEEYVLKEILKDCNLYERIVMKVHCKTFIKLYNITRINLMNKWLSN